jgi:hypothetical protein
MSLLFDSRSLLPRSSGRKCALKSENLDGQSKLYGCYYGELLRGIRWKAWDPRPQYIYSSAELLRHLQWADGRPETNTLIRARLQSD